MGMQDNGGFFRNGRRFFYIGFGVTPKSAWYIMLALLLQARGASSGYHRCLRCLLLVLSLIVWYFPPLSLSFSFCCCCCRPSHIPLAYNVCHHQMLAHDMTDRPPLTGLMLIYSCSNQPNTTQTHYFTFTHSSPHTHTHTNDEMVWSGLCGGSLS